MGGGNPASTDKVHVNEEKPLQVALRLCIASGCQMCTVKQPQSRTSWVHAAEQNTNADCWQSCVYHGL